MACLKGFCAHTEFMLEPWWYVDLGEDRSIVEIGKQLEISAAF